MSGFAFTFGYRLLHLAVLETIVTCNKLLVLQLGVSDLFYNSVVSVHVFECTIVIVGYRVYVSVGDRLEVWAVLVAERVTMQ